MSRNMHKYEELTPYEFNKEKEQASIVYVAAGPLEYHEECNALGIIEEIERRGIRLTVGHHDAIPLFLPQRGNEYFPEHYYETHPEYYKMTDEGTRFEVTDHFGSWILCSRNPDVVQVIADNIVSWIEKNPTVDTIALWPLDGKQPLCTCPECGKYSDIENYVYAQNQIAKIIGEKHPEIKIDMLAYSNLLDCPDNLELEPNLFIDEAVTSAKLKIRTIGKPDGTCLTGSPYEENILKWKKTALRLCIMTILWEPTPADSVIFRQQMNNRATGNVAWKWELPAVERRLNTSISGTTSSISTATRLDPLAAEAVQSETTLESEAMVVEHTLPYYNPNAWLTFNDEEQDVIDEYYTALVSRTEEMLSKFLLGQEPLSKFDEFRATLDEMGLQELLAAYESAYARVK